MQTLALVLASLMQPFMTAAIGALLHCLQNMMNAQSLPLGGTCNQTCWLAEACTILLLVLLQDEVVSLSAQLQQLRDQFGQKTSEQLDLKAKADLMERRLTAASKLIAGLSSERVRWTADMQVDLLHHLPVM